MVYTRHPHGLNSEIKELLYTGPVFRMTEAKTCIEYWEEKLFVKQPLEDSERDRMLLKMAQGRCQGQC